MWKRTLEARTILFEYRPLEAVHTNINATIVVGGVTINNVNPSEGIAALDDIGIVLAVDIDATQAANITNSSNARAGYVRCQITAGTADTITGWMRTEAADTGGEDTRLTDADIALFKRRNPTSVLTLTDGATIAWDVDDGLMAQVTIAGNRTINNPTNVQTGDVLVLEIRKTGTSSPSLIWGTNFRWPSDIEGTIVSSSTAGRFVFTFLALSPTDLIGGPVVSDHR